MPIPPQSAVAYLEQVWGGQPPSKRNTSVSSANSVNEISPPHMGDHWTTSRGTNGAWEDATGSPNRNDLVSRPLHAISYKARSLKNTVGLPSPHTSTPGYRCPGSCPVYPLQARAVFTSEI